MVRFRGKDVVSVLIWLYSSVYRGSVQKFIRNCFFVCSAEKIVGVKKFAPRTSR